MSDRPESVAVIGAGIAGASATRVLRDNGISVDCFEKSRGSGGRASTRRVSTEDGHEFHFDHGAQYFTAESDQFREVIDSLRMDGRVAEWDPRVAVRENESVSIKQSTTERFVAKPGMSSLADLLFGDFEPEYETRVESIRKDSQGLTLQTEKKTLNTVDAVIVTAPPAQSASIVAECSTNLAEKAGSVTMQPVWAVMLGYEVPLDVEFDAVFVNQGSLDWMARNSSKPDRPPSESWILHATSNWSLSNLDVDSSRVVNELVAEFDQGVGSASVDGAVYSSAHRWLYAKAGDSLDCDVLFDADANVTLAGDWIAGNRIEGAFRSGTAAAWKILESESR